MRFTQGTIAFVTLGCAKNEVDTDKMAARLLDAGYTVVEDALEAELTIVNTCAFLTSAVDEGLDVIFDLVNDMRDKGTDGKVLVAGCMPARYGADLADELTEVDGFVSADEESDIVERVRVLIGPALSVEAPSDTHLRAESRPSAYVKISDGCSRLCTYCMIPYIRGRYHSYPLASIDAEVSELVAGGTREVVLIGQDTGLWGRDFDDPSSTAALLEHLAEHYPQTWFRLLYLQPGGITDELLDCIAAHDNICPYLDMPLQHADRSVLERMNRHGDGAEYLATLARVRERVPGIATRTTFMAGFPGETDEQFEELLDFAQEAQFDYAGVFAYSPEDGSAAAGFSDQIPDALKLERAQELLDTCETVGCGRMSLLEGRVLDALIEGYELTDVGTEALCRCQLQAPEVDGQIHVPIASESEAPVGSFIQVRITGSFFYELEGELVA